ncbi:2-deoxy-D-gluconate 3-dehydrogenase [Sphingobium lactosutens]|uniref:SDR family NAD(P)-dependent oxidoreductase n=1 Tax=Sphingobium lactosutens TaxID=522773 RepID=UPI0015BF76B8|nr:SDR family oxidoreductase [Sphingobium lactosutens]NWK97439.1 2-deoxy-D-gluconate 3-dehydrogenase [Sphingobium lactosutens]
MPKGLLAGKRALITGASSGLGRQFANILVRAGAHGVVAARRTEALDTLIAEIAAYGGSAEAVVMDVTDRKSVINGVAQAGAVDILVNAAGVTNSKPVLDQTEADYELILGTNLKGAFLTATEVARGMRDRKRGGSIINIASILGLRQAGHVTPYAISKAAVIQLTKQLALELARYGIRVNALAPGYVDTALNHSFFTSDAGSDLVQRNPMRRLGTLEDLEAPLLLLASDGSNYMTGSVLTVDGGHMVSTL